MNKIKNCLICFLYCVGLFQWFIWSKCDIEKVGIFHVERTIYSCPIFQIVKTKELNKK